jgi:adenosylcobyric acid synthase
MDGDYKDGRYYGTYIHGIFDSKEFREKILNDIRDYKGIEERKSEDLNKKRLEEIEKLADGVSKNMDIDYIYSIMGVK